MAENLENDAELEDWNPEQSPAVKVMRESKTYAAYKMNCDLRGLLIATKEVVDSGVAWIWWSISREHDGKWMILGSANGMGFNLEPTTDCGLILHTALEIVDKVAGSDSKRKMLANLVGRKFVPRSAWMLDEKGDPIWWTGQASQAATQWN